MEELARWLPPILVVIGWWVVNAGNTKRENRKEARALLDSAKITILECAKLGVEDMVAGASHHSYAIKAGLDNIEIEFERMPNWGKASPLMSRFIEFSEALTGGDFDAKQRQRRDLADPEIACVTLCRNRLLTEMERQFKAYFL